MKIRTYSELVTLKTFEERFEYLQLNGSVGKDTFGFDRFLNQNFYTSGLWYSIRNRVIVRDNGCDLGMEGHQIGGTILIHHMNPISVQDIREQSEWLTNPEFLISTILSTHNAIHYGDKSLLVLKPVERTRNDTCPWKH
jgi:hypothetical protein